MKCCICGKEIKGCGNNPCGALNQNAVQINWEEDDRCCDECNNKYVITGRLATMYKISKINIKHIMPDGLIKRK